MEEKCPQSAAEPNKLRNTSRVYIAAFASVNAVNAAATANANANVDNVGGHDIDLELCPHHQDHHRGHHHLIVDDLLDSAQQRLKDMDHDPQPLHPHSRHSAATSLIRVEDEFDHSHAHSHSHLQHDFAEDLDDETTTSGVLETFEISSSNSLPACSDGPPSAAAVAVDDSSSTDIINIVQVSGPRPSCKTEYVNGSPVYVINDDDDDEDDEEEARRRNGDEGENDQEEEDDDDVELDVATQGNINANGENQLEVGVGGPEREDETVADDYEEQEEEEDDDDDEDNQSLTVNPPSERSCESMFTRSGSTPVCLETPIVEEQPHLHVQASQTDHQHHHSHRSTEPGKSGHPKRLSDEFETQAQPQQLPAEGGDAGGGSGNVETQHDKMSFRLKRMNINHNNANNVSSGDCLADASEMPSSSRHSSTSVGPSRLEIDRMDLIERRDFETEQHLTGRVILKSHALMGNKNAMNLNLLRSMKQQQDQLDSSREDGPSSSKNTGSRAVSSDSKCMYAEHQSTPTSSRNHNSRLTKSTAKIHLYYSSLSQPDGCEQPSEREQEPQPSSSSSSPSPSPQEGPSTSRNSARNQDAADLSNSNSSDSVICTGVITTQQQHQQQQQQQESHEPRGPPQEVPSGNGVVGDAFGDAFDDAQPSTSSARCQYSPHAKNLHGSVLDRQRHVAGTAGGGGGGGGGGAQLSHRAAAAGVAFAAAASTSTSASVAGVAGTAAAASVAGSAPLGNLRIANATSRRSRRRSEPTAHLNHKNDEEFASTTRTCVGAAAVAAAVARAGRCGRAWVDCDESNGIDAEEVCTCDNNLARSSRSSSNASLNDTDDAADSTVASAASAAAKDGDLSNYIKMVSISEETSDDVTVGGSAVVASSSSAPSSVGHQQRKRKYNDGRLPEGESNGGVTVPGSSGCSASGDANGRKRIAYDYTSTPRSSHQQSSSMQLVLACPGSGSKRTPRSLIPTRENPPPELQNWLAQFQRWSHAERLLAVDRLIEHCEPTQVRHMMKTIEPQFQRDFISLLPRELALQVLSFLEPKDLLRAAQTCRSWRYLCDDNLLWKEKCRRAQILTDHGADKPKRGWAGNMPPIASRWKAAYMRQNVIEMNWRSRPIREPKILKGHDDHVITCLQFSGKRIVSGSDDNTLKVWSAVTGRCLRTLIGHTGGVWSSQMSGNIIISGSTDRTLKVWDMETGQCIHTLQGHTSTVRCMHLHGNKVVSGSRDASLRVWDIENGTCLNVLNGHLAAVRCVQYDGKLIVSGAYDYMVKIWHPERPECLHTLQGHTNRVYSLQFDGIHVVSGSLDTSIRVWDAETGNLKHTLMGHQSLTSGMELRQNILVSGNADSTVKIWDITTGQCLQTLSGPNKHQSAVTCLQFNSRFVVTSSDDGTVKLWDVKTGEFIRNLVSLESGGSGGVVWRIRASDTKLICAVGSRNGTEETKLMVLDFDVEGACVKCS